MNKRMRQAALVSALMFGSLTGCSGSRSHVVAAGAQYPVSMSDGVRDADGKLLPDERKKVVGGFQYDYTSWGMFWRIFSFTGDRDISQEVNEQVKKAQGDAIVNLSVKSESCLWTVFTLIGILPDCSDVRVRGHIIKAEPVASAAPLKSAPAEPSAPSAEEAPVSSIDADDDHADLAMAQ